MLTNKKLIKMLAFFPFMGSPILMAAETKKPFIMVVYVPGGWDTTMVFDNKLAESNIAQESKASAKTGKGDITYVDHTDRPSVKSFFTNYGDIAAIINGIYIGEMSHQVASERLFEVQDVAKSVIPTDWLAHYALSEVSGDFPYVIIDQSTIGGTYSGSTTYLTSDLLSTLYNEDIYPNLTEEQQATIDSLLLNRLNTLLEKFPSLTIGQIKVNSWRSNLLKFTTLRSTIKQHLAGLQSETNITLRNGKFLINLFAAGVTKAGVVSDGESMSWDTHEDHFAKQSSFYEKLFANLISLYQYAQSKKIDDNIIFLVMSEMGRAPYLNKYNGKDHWPYTSFLVFGKGINGGKTFGLTDASLRGVYFDPLFNKQAQSGAPLDPKSVFAAILMMNKLPFSNLMGSQIQPLSALVQIQETSK